MPSIVEDVILWRKILRIAKKIALSTLFSIISLIVIYVFVKI